MKPLVYVVDNDPVLLFLMSKLMERTKFADTPEFYENGSDALLGIRKIYNQEDVFVIFLDLNMPEMNGWEFLDELDKFTSLSNTIVFMISSSVDTIDKEKANGHWRISEFLIKPIEESKLLELKNEIEKGGKFLKS